MFKKLLLGALLVLLVSSSALAETYYFWRYRESASCSGITDGKARDLCWDTTAACMYKCAPLVGTTCDAAEDWKIVSGGWFDDGTNVYLLTPRHVQFGNKYLKGNATTGLYFDPDNDGSVEVTFTNAGVISSIGGFEYLGDDAYINVLRAADRTIGVTEGDLWYRSSDKTFRYYDGTSFYDLARKVLMDPYIIKSPSAPTVIPLFYTSDTIRVTAIHGIVDPGGAGESVVADIQQCSSTGTSCVSITGASITFTNTGGADAGGLFSNPEIAADKWVVASISSVTGTPDALAVTLEDEYSAY